MAGGRIASPSNHNGFNRSVKLRRHQNAASGTLQIAKMPCRKARRHQGAYDHGFDHGFSTGVLYLHMTGSCSGCPNPVAPRKSGVENLLCHAIPEVVERRALR
jgi:hypothetical protein